MCRKYWVYVIQNEKGNWTYTGHTNDVKRRLHDHNRGKMGSTRYHRPFKVIFTEEFSSRSEAMIKEKFLKSGKGRQIRENLFKTEEQ